MGQAKINCIGSISDSRPRTIPIPSWRQKFGHGRSLSVFKLTGNNWGTISLHLSNDLGNLSFMAIVLCTLFSLLFFLSHSVSLGEEPITRIACGSCYRPKNDRGIFKTILKEEPNLFLFMGDNIYADTDDMSVLEKKYNELLKQPDYKSFAKKIPILATWDDHDYGFNDSGREFSKKNESQKIFLDSFRFPKNHAARLSGGVYHSAILGPKSKRVHIILLDTRFFRSALMTKKINGRKTILPSLEPTSTMLGEEQWKWLTEELAKPAELRLIVSSIQFIATSHRFEKWANMPKERLRFLTLLKKSKAIPTVLLSGDRHLAEVARLTREESDLTFDLYEMTSSGMTHAGGPDDASPSQIKGTYFRGINFGLIEIDWSKRKPNLTFNIKDIDGKTMSSTEVGF